MVLDMVLELLLQEFRCFKSMSMCGWGVGLLNLKPFGSLHQRGWKQKPAKNPTISKQNFESRKMLTLDAYPVNS